MKTYGQYCPIARGSEVFAERWTPLILRNMHLGCETFSEILAGLPGMSRSLLSSRLRQLEREHVLTHEASRYRLTTAGEELTDLALDLGTWGARWLDNTAAHADPFIVLWVWHRTVTPENAPPGRVVVRFDIRTRPRQRYWLLFEHGSAEVCVRPPGIEDLIVETDPMTLMHLHMGRMTTSEAEARGSWIVTGPRRLARHLLSWGGLSPFADVQSARAG
jgi:DNA-binding HxlR family transcriptional regulator